MFTKRSTNLYCIAIFCLYTETIESRETPLLRRRKQNSPFCLAELFHFSPFLFLQKEENRPGSPSGGFSFLPYCRIKTRTFTKRSRLFYCAAIICLYTQTIKSRETPLLRRRKQNSPFCLAELFHFSPFLFYKSEKAARAPSDGFFVRFCGELHPYKRDAPTRKGSRAGATGEKMRYL